MIPEGSYSAKAVDVCLGYTKNGGQQIEIRLAIIGGEQDGGEVSYTGGFAGDGAQYTLAAMRACGWDDLHPIEDCKRNTVDIEVTHREYNGKKYEQVRIFTPRKGCRTKPENRMDARAADAFLRSLVTPANAKTEPKKPMRQMGDDEDLPY